jgi:hypothetical protein
MLQEIDRNKIRGLVQLGNRSIKKM